MTFLQTLDGTGRKPFSHQVEFLEWLQQQTARIVAAQLPPGSGKSFIARTIQRKTGALVVTPSNLLVNQYSAAYPAVNVLKGQTHYLCDERGVTCADVKALKLKPCEGCTYRACRRAALEGQPTFANPMSLYALTQDPDLERPGVTVVDEAHQLLDLLLLIAGFTFTRDKHRTLPQSEHTSDVVEWLAAQRHKMSVLSDKAASPKAASQVIAAHERFQLAIELLEADPTNYVVSLGQERRRDGSKVDALIIKPILPPKPLLDKVLGDGRIVLLSGTLSRMDAELLTHGEPYAYYDMPSPISPERRQVLYRPHDCTSPESLVNYARKLHAEFSGPTLVHVTYSLSERLAPLLKGELRNTAETKDAVVAKFKTEGGLFFASGCAEGLDLPDDQCRLNIVPILPRPNIGDPTVKKWLAQPGGSRRYDMETLRTLQQQLGRSTRHAADRSVLVVCDPRFPQLVSKNRADISDSFYTSIQWDGKLKGGT